MISIYWWAVVIFVTSLAVIFGAGWLGEHADRRIERITLLAQLDQATANIQPLPRAGYLPGPPFAGAQDPAYMAPVPWELASAAYALGQQRASQDEITRQVDEIMLEVELHPERWQ